MRVAALEVDQVQQKTGPPDVRNETAESSKWTWDEFSTRPEFVHRNYTEMESFLKAYVS